MRQNRQTERKGESKKEREKVRENDIQMGKARCSVGMRNVNFKWQKTK